VETSLFPVLNFVSCSIGLDGTSHLQKASDSLGTVGFNQHITVVRLVNLIDEVT
jgi:hypothetical protein